MGKDGSAPIDAAGFPNDATADRTGGAVGASLSFHVRRATAAPRRATTPTPTMRYIPRAKGRADYAVESVSVAEHFGDRDPGGSQPSGVGQEGVDWQMDMSMRRMGRRASSGRRDHRIDEARVARIRF